MKNKNLIWFALGLGIIGTGCSPSTTVNAPGAFSKAESTSAPIPATPGGTNAAVDNATTLAAPAAAKAAQDVQDAIGSVDPQQLTDAAKSLQAALQNLSNSSSSTGGGK